MTQLGFQASSLKPYLTTARDVRATFGRLRSMGYRHVQLQWIDRAVPLEATAEALAETGLVCIATQDSFAGVQADMDFFQRMNRLWRSRTMCVSTIPEAYMTPEGLARFAREAADLAAAFAEDGVGLSFHPTCPNFAPVGGECAVDVAMRLLPEDVKLTLCVLQAERGGVDPLALLARYRGRVDMCHFKDARTMPDGTERLTPVGQGRIDWPPIFEACRRTGVPWGLAEQETWDKDAFLCAKESLEYIAGHGVVCPGG